MSIARHHEIRELFLAALEHAADERQAFLTQRCGRDGELRQEVEALLEFHDEPPGGGSSDAARSDEVPSGATRSGPARSDGAPSPRSPSGQRRSSRDTAARAAERFESGQVFAGRYRIVNQLGSGGMGEVYRAQDLVLDEPVALKFLPAERRPRLEWLVNEVRLARQVTHPNVCRVYDFGEADGEIYLTMEYIDGENLASLLARIGRFPQDKLLDVARQLCAGLAAAHVRGVLHRDLKPANIMIDGRGRAKITDFGIAASIAERAAEAEGEDQRMIGTPAYMAPEQLEAKPASPQSDLYALGLVLYEMTTGRPVFSARTPVAYAELHRSATPVPPSQQVSHLDSRLEAAVLSCLEKDPQDRPPSARALALQLPGLDRLQMAIEAGETPSPEAVASSGREEILQPSTAGLLLALLGLFLVSILALSDRAYPDRAPWADQPPAVRADRGLELLERLGYPGGRVIEDPDLAVDRAWGFYPAPEWASDRAAGRFWIRTSPESLIPDSQWATFFPRVDYLDPPLLEPGMMRLALDPHGKLRELSVIAETPATDRPPAAAAPEVDWEVALEAAGYRRPELVQKTPVSVPPMFADQRMAWTGVGPERHTRIDAAALSGRVVWFEVRAETAPPESSAQDADEPAPAAPASLDFDLLWGVYLNISHVFWLLLTAAAIVLARINLQAGRGDLQGARRLALTVGLINAAYLLFTHDHLPELGPRWELILGVVLVQALVAWLAYIALEPVVRRWWPRALIAWSRLLRGQVRDPLVGRSLLIGTVAGSGWVLLTLLDRLVTRGLGLEPAPEIFVLAQLEGAQSGRMLISHVLSAASEALSWGVLDLFFLVGLRVVTRHWAAAIPIFIAWNGTLETLEGIHPAVSWLTLGVGIAGVSALLLVRFGLLAYAAALFAYMTLLTAPVTIDVTAWYAESGFFLLALVAAVGVFGYRAALAERSVSGHLTGFETASSGSALS